MNTKTYNPRFYETKSTEWIEAKVAELEKRSAGYLKQLQTNNAQRLWANLATTNSTLRGARDALADRRKGLI